jgi:F0F1-type ATP synthase membrane subunit b/b'
MKDKRHAAMRKVAEAKSILIIEKARKTALVEAIKIIAQVGQKGHQIINESLKTAEAESSKIIAQVEEKGHQIINESLKTAEAESSKIIAQAEEKARQIVEEAREKAQAIEKAGDMEAVEGATPARPMPGIQQTLNLIGEKALFSKMRDNEEQRKDVIKQRADLVAAPPTDLGQV